MKKLVSMLTLAMVLSASVASASVPAGQMNVGGVSYRDTPAQVAAVCGQPIKTKTSKKTYGEKTECKYANGLEVTFVDGVAQKIEVDDDSALATAGGVKIGMDASVLQEVYGQPDRIHKNDYIYYMDGRQDAGLVFEVKHGVVNEIECGRLH
ncbi:MAG: hypothetical protein ACTTKW_01660 [Schwartzia sp. (in: firmicutes)]